MFLSSNQAGLYNQVDPFGQSDKQLFQSVEINMFVPVDPQEVTLSFKLLDFFEDSPEKLQRLSYHVSFESA